jgi:membrane peptidoglycan carboxypeptidase
MTSDKRPTQLKQKLRLLHRSLKPKKVRLLLYSFSLISLVTLIGLILLFKDVPNPQRLTKNPAPSSTQILDRNGKLLYEIYIDQNRQPININDLPEYVKQATIAIEDKNFYRHFGLDTTAILRATIRTLTGQRLEGGSTITQQLVKIALLSDPSRTLTRKIKEAGLAIATELTYSKDQILELYLNHAPYGGTSYGIEIASKTFFGKSAKDLNLAEATLLAGLPQSPTKYSPFGANPDLAITRQHTVLRRMVEDGYIDEATAEKTKQETLKFITPNKNIKAPHFSLMIKDFLTDRYGEDLVNLGGLKVTTTLDLDLQEYTQSTLTAEIKKIENYKVKNGAALITKPQTGEILAMIGSSDYFDEENDGNVNLTMRLRQPGSSIKPLNYAVGLLKGWTPSTMYLDTPTCFNSINQKSYCPKNYDGSFHGPVQMRFALGNSYNIPAVKQLALNGLDAMIATSSAMGIKTWTEKSRFGLSLTLGGGEVTMWDMTEAFGTFANAGIHVPLNPILKVETYKGEILEESKTQEIADLVSSLPENWNTFWQNQEKTKCLSKNSQQPADNQHNELCVNVALPEEVAYIISHILLDNNARVGAFGNSSKLVIPGKTVSVKTGTTNDLRDNWTIGYTPEYLIATWVGNNDNTPMSRITSGVTGAAPIWNIFMKHLLKDQKDRFPKQPDGIEFRDICSQTGLIPTPENPCETRSEIFIKSILPPTNISTKKQIWVRRSDKFPLLPGDQTIDLDLEEHLVFSDPFAKDYCLDCAYPKDDKGNITWPETIINYDNFQLNPPSPQNYLNLSPTPTDKQ